LTEAFRQRKLMEARLIGAAPVENDCANSTLLALAHEPSKAELS
jgi:hypothetical protein